MIEMNHECQKELEVVARAALDAAREFWDVKQAAGLGGAVQWLRDDAGGLLIFTRAEYRDTLMQNIEEVRDLGKVVTFGDQLDVLELQAEVKRLQEWVNDLLSGMYINCVYCGHRYGPRESTPVAMADVLEAHIEKCPKHPLSHAKAEIKRLQTELDTQTIHLW